MARRRILNQREPYFLTLTTVGWIDIFTRKVYRDVLIDSLRYCQQEKELIVWAYVIMSNHVHLVAQVPEDARWNLSEVLRDFKKFTANRILEMVEKEPESRREWLMHLFDYFARFNRSNRYLQFWQQGNHPTETFTMPILWQKINYIHLNPVRAGIVEKPEDYLYSSARNYMFGHGLLEVELVEPT